jgi:hypothetical protein
MKAMPVMPVMRIIVTTHDKIDGKFIDEFINPVHAIRALDDARIKWLRLKIKPVSPQPASDLVASISRCCRIAIACNRIKEIKLSITVRKCQRIWLARYYNPDAGVGMLKSMERYQGLAIV